VPTLFDAVSLYAGSDPDRLAVLSEQDGVRTYSELAATAAALAGAMADFGVQPGDRLCLWSENLPQWLEMFVAGAAAGCVPVPANPQWTDSELEFVLRHSGSRVLACQSHLVPRALKLLEKVGSVAHVIGLDGGLGAPTVSELAEEFAGSKPTPATSPVGAILYTSGTTSGTPKAVSIDAKMLVGGGISYKDMFGLGPADRALVVTPFFHGNGMGGALSALGAGASVVFPRRFSARAFWPLVDLHRPTYFFTLVQIVNILLSLPERPLDKRHGMRVWIALGSSPVAGTIERRYSVPVIDWYAMTEAGQGTYTRLDEERRPGSAGRVFPGTDMRIFLDDGTEAAPGQVGEVVFHRSSLSFDGYLDNPEATGETLRGQWFHTGDMGYFDQDGYFYFVDRRKDIVRRGGENISSMEVEGVLREHPDVGDAAVVGAPDPVLGEKVTAFITIAEGRPTPDVESIQRFAGEYLAPFKIPGDVLIVDELPRTTNGKVEKFRLRQRLSATGAPGSGAEQSSGT
jgi:acyl-CoA synthetase (AMP-forming)/AMP-acid ligase II